MLPNMDHPEAFGQHPNADITSQIQETRMMFDTLLSLQPQISTGAGESREEKVREREGPKHRGKDTNVSLKKVTELVAQWLARRTTSGIASDIWGSVPELSVRNSKDAHR
jgi:hypothetical protein